MNKTTLLIIIGIVTIIGGALTYALLRPAEEPVPQEMSLVSSETANSDNAAQTDAATTPGTQPGIYKDYSKTAVENTSGTKLLFFHAPWCPQCRAMEESITNDGLPNGVTVFKVDYDSNQALRQQYGVTIQTTFVNIDDDGNKIASYVAYEEPVFSKVEAELLK
jgi:thiol-disulfide isomerase/thioredoxin